jgi:iron complex outermembrane recepter protein
MRTAANMQFRIVAGRADPFNAGALIGDVRVVGPDLAAESIGTTAFGQPHNQLQFNLDYTLPALPKLSLDMNLYHFGTVPASVSNAVYDSSVTILSLGDRYKFKMLGAPATLRLQVQNLTNSYIWNTGFSPGFLQLPPRAYVAYLTVDI